MLGLKDKIVYEVVQDDVAMEKTKQAILEAAIPLFNENGYESTSIEQIAKLAGVGKVEGNRKLPMEVPEYGCK